jgi:hypothetical protein
VLVAGDEPVAVEQAVLEFLVGDLVLRWAEAVLGLQSSSLANDLGEGAPNTRSPRQYHPPGSAPRMSPQDHQRLGGLLPSLKQERG